MALLCRRCTVLTDTHGNYLRKRDPNVELVRITFAHPMRNPEGFYYLQVGAAIRMKPRAGRVAGRVLVLCMQLAERVPFRAERELLEYEGRLYETYREAFYARFLAGRPDWQQVGCQEQGTVVG
jgi:hypothetical protein